MTMASSSHHSRPSKRQKKADEEKAAGSPENKAPVVVFAHGAGAPSSSEWMLRWKEMLQKELCAAEVITFDYPYMSGGKRKAPPKAENLIGFHLSIIKEASERYAGHPLILAGKSMGSRVSCMVAIAEDIHVDAIICLGYPLKGSKGATREDILLQLRVPTVFVQGSKDSLCPIDKLKTTLKKMKASNALYIIDNGDHSFKIGKRNLQASGLSQAEAEERAISEVGKFISRYTKGK